MSLLYILKRLETQERLRKNKQILFRAFYSLFFAFFVFQIAYSPRVSVFLARFSLFRRSFPLPHI